MAIYGELTGVCWLILMGVWLLTALGAKKSLRGREWWSGAIMRIAILAIVILIIRLPGGRRVLLLWGYGFPHGGTLMRAFGVALCACGVALAIWARVHLGRNWGIPMSLKQNPELVTGGPYAAIRHPIYTGILVAILGSALATGGVWLIPFAFFCAYFVYSAAREEKNMTRQFPAAYPDYKKRTWMLIPFVL